MTGEIRLPGLPELRRRGFLLRELGAADAPRFLHLCETGHGDYTRERDQWLSGLTVEEIEEGIYRMKAWEEI